MSVQLEKPSDVVRKLTIRVPATVVAQRLDRGLAEVQRTAKLKGFRPGQAPISIIKQYYGEDVRHRVFHNLIDESFQEAVREHKIRAIGNPKIDTSEHQKGAGAHDHGIDDGKDLTFTATVEILPDLEIQGYKGIALTRENADVTDENVEGVVKSLLDSRADLVPASGGLVTAEGGAASRPAKTGDFADIQFVGGLKTETGVTELEGMKGSRVVELGSGSLIPGFEEQIAGMRGGETKTFEIDFPADYHDKDLSAKKAQFTVTVNELKEKKVPELTEEFARELGYEGIIDLRQKARDHILRERTEEIDRKLKSDLLEAVIEKNQFEVPGALIESQTRALVQDWAQELKRQGIEEKIIQDAVVRELDSLKKRAENQVRASLVLENVARKENITLTPQDLDEELGKAATSMRVEKEKLAEFYAKDPAKRDDFEFRLRQERTLKFMVDNAKIKTK